MKAIVSKKTAKINKKTYLKKQTDRALENNKSILGKFLNEKKIINKQMLQWMAFFFMTIDHIGMMIFPEIEAFREIGRLAFPIFCFLLTEGFVHTHDRSKYYLRLVGAALISEIPYNIAVTGNVFDASKQNVMFELLFGFIAMSVFETFSIKLNSDKDRVLKNILIWVFTVVIGVIAEIWNCDYGLYGVLLIMMFYFFRKEEEIDRFLIYFIGMFVITALFYFGQNQIFCVLSLIPIYFYNSKPEKKIGSLSGYKYFNYFYYPVHFIVLYGILQAKELILNLIR